MGPCSAMNCRAPKGSAPGLRLGSDATLRHGDGDGGVAPTSGDALARGAELGGLRGVALGGTGDDVLAEAAAPMERPMVDVDMTELQ